MVERVTIQRSSPPGLRENEPRLTLYRFITKCTSCTISFIPIHWYGSFESFASHVGEYHQAFPGIPLWVTELGFAHQSLTVTQGFFNASVEYLDRLEYVQRYSWFGAFRADVSNVGPNGAMLSDRGEVTEIGKWYLGRSG